MRLFREEEFIKDVRRVEDLASLIVEIRVCCDNSRCALVSKQFDEARRAFRCRNCIGNIELSVVIVVNGIDGSVDICLIETLRKRSLVALVDGLEEVVNLGIVGQTLLALCNVCYLIVSNIHLDRL